MLEVSWQLVLSVADIVSGIELGWLLTLEREHGCGK